MSGLKDLDIVEFLVDFPEENIGRGMTGTIVHVYDDQQAFEVEATVKIDLETGDRETVVVTVKRDEIIYRGS